MFLVTWKLILKNFWRLPLINNIFSDADFKKLELMDYETSNAIFTLNTQIQTRCSKQKISQLERILNTG